MDVDVQEQKRRNEVEKVLLDGAAAIVLHCGCFDLVYFAADDEAQFLLPCYLLKQSYLNLR
jgi:hypothetical protein